MKTCNLCKIKKQTSDFSEDKRNKNGLQSRCKKCVNIKSGEWRKKNVTRAIEATRLWKKSNPEKLKSSRSNYRLKNLERYRVHDRNYQSRKRNNGGKLSVGLFDNLFKLQRGKCACCHADLAKVKPHLDHRMPLALGGSNTDDNIQLLCQKCNNQKHAKHPIDFMQSKGYLL